MDKNWDAGLVRTQMSPTLALKDGLNRTFADPKGTGKAPLRLAGRGTPSNINDLFGLKPGIVVISATLAKFWIQAGSGLVALGGASFGDHISGVVPSVTDEEVIRIDAASVVAPMQAAQSRGDCSVGEFVREAMSENKPSLDSDGSISSRINTGCPVPTLTRLIYLRPETGQDVLLPWRHRVRSPYPQDTAISMPLDKGLQT